MMKRLKIFLLGFIAIGLSLTATVSVAANDEGIDEKYGLPRVVYGAALSESQQEEVRRLLDVTDPDLVDEYTVTGEDLARYIGGNPDANMYSSAKITRKPEGHGIVVQIVSADNITQVTSEMYANAMITAGVENAEVEVASPVKVSGHSALTGIYKAFNVDGEALDPERMEVANEELELATELADQEGMDDSHVSELLSEIKQQIAQQNPVSREEVEQIIEEQLNKLNLQLSEEHINQLTDLFDKMRSINIDFGQVTEQLEDIARSVQNRLRELSEDEGFWESVRDFFSRIVEAVRNLFG